MPQGINLPKAAIALAAAASGLVGTSFGFLLLAFGLSGSPDFSFQVDQLAWVLPPAALAVFCGRLLRTYSEPLALAGRDVRASLTAPVWLGNFGLSLALALYFLADAPTGTQYRGVLIGPGLLWMLVTVAFVVAFGCAWAIARSLRALLALALTALLAAALQVSEAITAWLA